jgi:hypothetical protein
VGSSVNDPEEIMMEYQAKIIGMADATNYLLGTVDSSNGFVPLPQLGEVVICLSLSMAKTLLREHNIYVAQLTFQTAYDEMCGLPASSEVHQTIHF